MLVLALAAQIAATDMPPPIAQWNSGRPASACNVGRLATRGGWPRETRARRLRDLPPARHEIAVLRQVGGCAVPVIVRDDVERDAR